MSVDSIEDRRLRRLWQFVKGWSPQILAGVVSVGSVVWAAVDESVRQAFGWVPWVLGGLLLAAGVAQYFLQKPSYMELAERVKVAEREAKTRADALQQAMRGLLIRLAEHCELDDNRDRISLYYFHDGKFVMVARYSRSPRLQLPGRRTYASDQGAIGKAWASGSAHMELPARRPVWEHRLVEKHGFDAEEVKKLAMQCQSIAALRIEVNHSSVGVIVFESVDRNRVTQRTIQSTCESLIFQALGELVAGAARLTTRGAELTAPPAPARTPKRRWKASKNSA